MHLIFVGTAIWNRFYFWACLNNSILQGHYLNCLFLQKIFLSKNCLGNFIMGMGLYLILEIYRSLQKKNIFIKSLFLKLVLHVGLLRKFDFRHHCCLLWRTIIVSEKSLFSMSPYTIRGRPYTMWSQNRQFLAPLPFSSPLALLSF